MRLPVSLLCAGFLFVASPSFGQTSGQVVDPPAPAGQAAALDYAFPGAAAGMLFFHVHAEKTAQFEAVVARIAQVLGASEDPVRQQQAIGWRVFRSLEEHANRIYVFVFDPVMPGVDYDPVKILSDGAPEEVQALYAQLKDAIVRIERMGLARVR
jgi:hypothetical protein